MTRVIDHLVTELAAIHYRTPIEIISGMAEGFDEAIAKAAISIGIPFHAYIPNEGYGSYYWGPPRPGQPRSGSQTGRDRMAEFNELLDQAASARYVCKSIKERGLHSNFWRNIAMVDDTDIVWAYDDGKQDGGTGHCVKYAKSKQVPIVTIKGYELNEA